MASFFYADIKTDELLVHGHSLNNSGQIELYDAQSSCVVILKAPATLPQSNITLTLPSTVSNTNSIMVNHDGTGELALITPTGDVQMTNYAQFTVNGISNTSTITSTANITFSDNKAIYFRDSNNFINSNSTGDMLIKSNSGNVFITATGEVVLLSKSNGTVKIINEGVNELGFIVETPNTYINFGGTTGTSGYGLRDNNGVLQLKNRPNTNTYPVDWSNLVTHLSNCADVSLTYPVNNNNALLYNAATDKWVNSSISTLGYYGAFYDTTTQTSSGLTSANAMKFNTTHETNGVSIVNNSNITVSHAGVYNIQFSAQVENTSSGTHDINIWLARNGSNESNTNTKVTVIGNKAKLVAAWNYVLTMNANDYVILYWTSNSSTNVQLTAEGTSVSPPRPAIPSVTATVSQIINIQDSTLRLGDLLNVNDTTKASNSLIQYNSAVSQWQSVSNITIDTGNLIKFGQTANISAPDTGNLTLHGGNINLVVPTGNEVYVHNNLRVNGTLYLDGGNNSNISAPVASNLDIKASNVNIIGTRAITCTGNLSVSGNILKNNNIIVGGPSFSVYANAGVSCASGSTVKMTLDTEDFDTGGCFNNTGSTATLNGLSVPSYSFSPNVPGYYQINGHVSVASFVGTTAGIVICSIFKNNVENKRGNRSIVFGSAGHGLSSVVSSVIYFNGTGDYVDLRFLHASGSTETTESGSIYGPYFNGCFLRGL